jgi:hypothetical protein
MQTKNPVAQARWRKRQDETPDKFNFSVLLIHNHHEPLSESAISQLHNAVDQIPEVGLSGWAVFALLR